MNPFKRKSREAHAAVAMQKAIAGVLIKKYPDGHYTMDAQTPDASRSYLIRLMKEVLADLERDEAEQTAPNRLVLGGRSGLCGV